MKNILIINGPNLNLLGKRNEAVYGSVSFEDFLQELREEFSVVGSAVGSEADSGVGSGVELSYFQTNIEGEIIDRLHSAVGSFQGVVLNGGGYTHTSVAIADAVDAVRDMGLPTVEVHISNILAREPFRHVSLLSPQCVGSIWGFGLQGYELAIRALIGRK